MKIFRATVLGYCMGVRRAMEAAEEALEKYIDKKIFTFGPLIHNKQALLPLEEKGLGILEENDIEAYITGIPYILNTRSNDGWSTAGSVEWNTDGGVRLGYNSDSDSHMAKNFYVPEDIPVLVENTGTIMGGG